MQKMRHLPIAMTGASSPHRHHRDHTKLSISIRGFRWLGKLLSFAVAGPLALIPAVRRKITAFWGFGEENRTKR